MTPFLINSQELENKPLQYNWFDEIIGKSNSGIYIGIQYVEHYRTLNENHKFFINPNFSIGSVVYSDQPYYNLELKYDVFEDQLLLRNSDQPILPTIVLEKSKISSFDIEGHNFINFPNNQEDEEAPIGFVETIVSNDSITCYQKHQKQLRTRLNDKIRYFEFKNKNSFYIYYKGEYYQINPKSSMTSIFPDYKIEIKALESQYKNIKKEDQVSYLKSVLDELFKLMSQTNSKSP